MMVGMILSTIYFTPIIFTILVGLCYSEIEEDVDQDFFIYMFLPFINLIVMWVAIDSYLSDRKSMIKDKNLLYECRDCGMLVRKGRILMRGKVHGKQTCEYCGCDTYNVSKLDYRTELTKAPYMGFRDVVKLSKQEDKAYLEEVEREQDRRLRELNKKKESDA